MITITRGDDRYINLYFIRSNKRPYDLTGWTKISVFFKKQDGTLLEKNTDIYSISAYAYYDNVFYEAEVPGSGGNTITLEFDGVKTIKQVLDEWNSAHPINKVISDAKYPETTVPPAGIITLANGEDSVRDVNVVSPILGHAVVYVRDTDTSQFMLGKALTFKAVIDKGPPTRGERRIIMFHNQLEVIDDRF